MKVTKFLLIGFILIGIQSVRAQEKKGLTLNEAINIALQTASANDLIIVCGSVFLVGEIDMHLVNESTIS